MSDSETSARRVGEEDGAPVGEASRRRFLGLAGATGGAAALSTLLAACGAQESESDPQGESFGGEEPPTDLDIVNYALFLEYLERDFYEKVLDSREITDAGLQGLLKDVYGNEREHADVLEKLSRQLGGTPPVLPRLAVEEVINGGQERILEAAATLENVGAAAYLGQAPRIENLEILQTALQIHTVEARHAAALNEVAGYGFRTGGARLGSVPDGALAQPMTRDEVLQEASAFVRG